MKNTIDPEFHKVLLATISVHGFSYQRTSLEVDIDTHHKYTSHGGAVRPCVRYTMKCLVSHKQLRSGEMPIALKLSLSLDSAASDTWATHNNPARAEHFRAYVYKRLTYLLKHGTFSSLN